MLRTASAATLVALLSSTSAFALEGKALLDKMIADTGTEFTYANAEEVDADTVKLSDVTIVSDETTLTMTTLTLDGLREEGDRVRLESSSSENLNVAFPLSGDTAKESETGKGTLKIASGTSENVLAPAGAILALTPKDLRELSGRMEVGSYVLNSIEGDFDGDGEFETTMSKIGFSDLSSPLDFRYDAEAMKAEGPAPEPLKIGSIEIADTKVVYKTGEVTVGSLLVNGLDMPATLDAAPQEWAQAYDKLTLGPVEVMADGNRAFALNNLTVDVEEAEGTAVRNTTKADGIFVSVAQAGGRAKTVLDGLGYQQFTGSVEGKGLYDFDEGIVQVDDVTIDLDDVGALSIAYKVTGYTPELAKSFSALSAEATQTGKPADPMAVMELLTQLKLESATVALKDDSLINRALEFQAAQMKTKPEQLTAGAPLFVGMALAPLGVPDFTAKVTDAVTGSCRTRERSRSPPSRASRSRSASCPRRRRRRPRT